MTGFTSVHDGRLHVHVYPTHQFQTQHLQLKLVVPLQSEGLTSTAMLPYLWMEGTEAFPSALALMQRTDELYGVALRAGIAKRGDRHIAEVYAGVPGEMALSMNGVFEEAQRLAFDVATKPYRVDGVFPEKHVTREKALHRRRIESLFDDKIAWAMDRCMQSVYADGRFGLPRLGRLDDVEAVTTETLATAHERLLSEAQAHLYLVGAWSDAERVAADALEALRRVLPSSRAAETGPIKPLEVRSGEIRRVTDEQPVRQGKLNLAFRTGTSLPGTDYPALMVYNGILGGFPHSKLFVNVREKASLAYYASSRLDGLTGVLAVQTGIEVAQAERAESIILEQVQAMKDGRIAEDELNYTKRGMRNQYLQANDQPMSLVDLHFAGVLAGKERALPDTVAAIEAVHLEDVVRVAQQVQLDTVYFLRSEVTSHA
ncbi:EF-P 5-aminopentanol modification-associated protein YfmF [Alicyclobacillus sp. ALC3]|uniref:EF-P 5-aminopentanol modification-associated protein YfmF n=1 Tax=Alicyclobacillus sp. ALC3 TaxID=2796143 RepID=UPI0023793DA0|nr:pitrilysin family protein [Alicyclobacillus sp. ALC3]WDL98008.1 insulinase family protein [Alicyclobacillus sp. ALC3]